MFVIIGLISGFTAGLLGVGGGLVVVPALIFLFAFTGFPSDHLTQMAMGTSLVSIIFSSATAAISHVIHLGKEAKWFWIIVPCLLLGSILGVIFASALSGTVLKIIFIIFIEVIGFYFIFKTKITKKYHASNFEIGSLFLFTGFISSMLGLGGGFLIIPFLTFFGLPMRQVISITSMSTLLIAMFGALTFFILGFKIEGEGFIYWPAAITIGLTAVISAWLAAKLSHNLPSELLERIFGIWSIFMGIMVVFTL